MDTHKRSLLKTATYRLGASVITALIVYIYTRRLSFMLGAGLIDVTAKVFYYFIHERMWVRVKWGKL